jgi:RsmE family RNA methyltransferase
MNLLLVEEHEVDPDGGVRLTGARATHLLQVLNVTRGQSVRCGVIDGPCGVGTVTALDGEQVTLSCAFESGIPPRQEVDLLLALPRPKVLQRLWPQLAALGVGRIMLSNAERVERHYFDTHVLSEAFYRARLIEGLMQARDTRLPTVSIHKRFRVLVEDQLPGFFPEGLRLVADPGATTRLADVICARPSERLLIAVGPEGGWNAFERRLLEAQGFEPVGMGPRTLRSDTATVALLALVHDARGSASR